MRQNELDEIVRANPLVDPTAIDRSRRAEKQLAEAGIELGGYRLTPALGGAIPASDDQSPKHAPKDDAGAEPSILHRFATSQSIIRS